MADDIFLTPEEQDEKARKWLKENGPALAIGIALGLGAIFGWNQYKDSIQTKAEAASVIYAKTLDDIRTSELADIDAQVTELKDDYAGSSYASKAALIKAKQLSVNDLPAAYEELQWVVDNSAEFGLQHAARIRQAKIKLALGELDAAKSLANYTPKQGFESNYAELLGDIAVQQEDKATARTHYQAAIDTLPASQAAYSSVLTIKLDRLPNSENGSADSAAEKSIGKTNVEGTKIEAVADETKPDAVAEGAKVEAVAEQMKADAVAEGTKIDG